ncbi:hypothetical protein [Galbibacter mesophilus]|uniref:hypothetical protein n=1 Tax=Galbibacter mesophilus TaxID=379069 RepID=UPI00191DDED5|nr:hypothetical protein [Galbibacter mesophilus]MCM5661733.1 hypothetical protein [Galbibacter mesophilus]
MIDLHDIETIRRPLRLATGTYFTSFGHLKDNGYTINSDHERITTRLNLQHEVREWLSGSVNVGYTISDANNNGQSEDSGSVFLFVDNIPSIYPLFLRDNNGNTVEDPIYGGPQYDYGEGRGFGGLTNAIADAIYSTSETKRHEINSSASLNFKFSDHLTFENTIGLQYFTTASTIEIVRFTAQAPLKTALSTKFSATIS